MLSIDNLHASVEGKSILNGINLDVKAGEIHAIMGPNGSGKSTLSSVIAGNEDYEVTKGDIVFKNESVLYAWTMCEWWHLACVSSPPPLKPLLVF